MASAEAHGLPLEHFDAQQIEQRLPLLKVPSHHVGLFEPEAGFLRVELCVAAMVNQAVKHGADLLSDTSVLGWHSDGGEIKVQTTNGEYTSKRLVIAAGAWSSGLLADLNLGLSVVQKQQHWFQLDRVDQKIENEFPCFLMEQDNGDCFYGMPEVNYLGMKICEHSGGRPSTVRLTLIADSIRKRLSELKRL